MAFRGDRLRVVGLGVDGPAEQEAAIVFPAFIGMTAGVGLSGDLANPRRSLPLGTLTGMVIYVAVVFKLAASASPRDLAAN